MHIVYIALVVSMSFADDTACWLPQPMGVTKPHVVADEAAEAPAAASCWYWSSTGTNTQHLSLEVVVN